MRSSPPQYQREIREKNEPMDIIDPVETRYDPNDIVVSRKYLDGHNKPYKMQRGMKPHMKIFKKEKELIVSIIMCH